MLQLSLKEGHQQPVIPAHKLLTLKLTKQMALQTSSTISSTVQRKAMIAMVDVLWIYAFETSLYLVVEDQIAALK